MFFFNNTVKSFLFLDSKRHYTPSERDIELKKKGVISYCKYLIGVRQEYLADLIEARRTCKSHKDYVLRDLFMDHKGNDRPKKKGKLLLRLWLEKISKGIIEERKSITYKIAQVEILERKELARQAKLSERNK